MHLQDGTMEVGKMKMKVKIADSYYLLHDHNKEHPHTSYCICCIQYIKVVMNKQQFQEVIEK